MNPILDNLRSSIENIIEALGYWGIAGLMVIENIFPPIPSELVLPLAGFLISEGQMHFIPLLIISTLGTLVGTTFLYYLGFFLGDQRLRMILKNYGRFIFFPEKSYDQALQTFNAHDKAIVFWSRLAPGLRSIISLPAGVARMPLGRFFIYTLLGTLIWNSLLLAAGVFLGANWTQVIEFIDRIKGIITILVLGSIGTWLFLKRRRFSKMP